MLIQDSQERTRNAPVFGPVDLPEEATLERHSWRNWILVTAILFVTTTGLAAVILSLIEDRGYSPWPWSHSDIALLGALVAVELLFIGYLTVQEKRVMGMRSHLVRLQKETIERMEHHYLRLDDILKVTRTTGASTDPQAVFDVMTRTCAETFHCDQVSLMLFDPKEGVLEVRSATGHENLNRVLGARQRLGHGVAGWVAEAREPLILGPHVDPARFQGLKNKVATLSAAMVVPIVLRDELLGVLSASSRAEGMRYDKNDLRALEVFAETTGISIRHAQQSEWMRETIRKLDAALQEQEIHLGLGKRPRDEIAPAA